MGHHCKRSIAMSRSPLGLALPLLLLAAAATPARADEAGAGVEPPPGTLVPAPDRPFVPPPPGTVVPAPDRLKVRPLPVARGAWYGWQVLAADTALAALTAGCLAGGGDNVCTIPVLGYFVAGPLVHASHDVRNRGVVSLGLRVGFPAVGALVGAALATCPPRESLNFDFCGLDYVGVGFLSGMAAAIAIDGIWAFEDASWQVTPTLKLTGETTGIGLAGRF